MSIEFEILAVVRDELDATAAELDLEHPGRGDKLRLRVAEAFERIAANPHQFRSYDADDPDLSGVRWLLVPDSTRFAVAYVDDPGRVVILAVADARREPAYWRRRLVTGRRR